MRNVISYFPESLTKEATDFFRGFKNVSFSGGGNASSKAMIVSSAINGGGATGNVLWVVSDQGEKNIIKEALSMWSDRKVFLYSRIKDEDRMSFPTTSDFERERSIRTVEFVSRQEDDKAAMFVLSFEDIVQNFPSKEELSKNAIFIKKGDKIDTVELIENLVNKGYEVGDDKEIKKGEYFRIGDNLYVFPVNKEGIYRLDIGFGAVDGIFSSEDKEEKDLKIFPIEFEEGDTDIVSLFSGNGLVVDDEVDVADDFYEAWNQFLSKAEEVSQTISFVSFNEDSDKHKHLHFLSVVKYRSNYDLANDLRDKINAKWKVLLFTKHKEETEGLLNDQKIPFQEGIDAKKVEQAEVFLIPVEKEDTFPRSFQNPDYKILLINDTDVSFVREEKRSRSAGSGNIFDDFLTGLKQGDYVVHTDHGIARFGGFDQKTVDGITKEYLKLEYAENDKLFVPIDQADKVTKYIGSEDTMPRLTRLGSADWNTITTKVKKETHEIAKELMALYAARKAARGYKFKGDEDLQTQFEKTFPYEETPGQVKAILDVKSDMENEKPMDRLVCGDVGFGKTEVAMRAAFKAVQSGKQVALIAPITILADQHYKSFKKRMEPFHVRIEMLSRFKSQKEQADIVERLAKWEVDIVIGTHRLIQPDVKFKNLGLIIVDEEQRFGVKQKEKLKEIRKEVDVLTLTATPIPRTLNICLNKIRDITTITTPPYGRLPVITEVRKYSASLVREAILNEIKRGGQVYFLHNRVQTIDAFAQGLKEIVPEASFVVAHGKLGSGDLEERVMAFKEHKYDVLVSSTIIENGIDLENANTLIVNGAERFGLAQLYQLRGRVGRGKVQAYAYFLYHGQRLKLDAKRRLRAIVEASDLGSGFQIAMKDLEIRGAGDILGANQHGVINVVGVSHFIRMLNKAVEDLRAGRVLEGEEEPVDVSIELPVQAFIPDSYISSSKDKISTYQKMSAADNHEYLKEIREELIEEYGKMPLEVVRLFDVIEMKIYAKDAGLVNVKAEPVPMSKDKEIVLYMSKKVKPANIISLLECNPGWEITGSRLRINMTKLGLNWFDGLKKSVIALTKEVRPGEKR